MAQKTLLTCTLLFGIAPLVTGCATTQDHNNLELKVRNQNNRIVNLEHQVKEMSSGGGESTKMLQRQQADLSSDLDRIKTQLLQMDGQLEESTHRNRTLLEENLAYQQKITKRMSSLVEVDQETQEVLEATSSRLNAISSTLTEEAKRKQDEALRAAELAAQKAAQAKLAQQKAAQSLQQTQASSSDSVVELTPRKEKGKNSPQVAVPATAQPVTAAPPEEVPASVKTTAEKMYDKGLGEYRAATYKDAIASFSLFLEQNPKHKLLPNAKYWLGASRLKDGDYSGAVLEFQHIVADYPQHPKAPEALLKQAEAFGYFGDKMVQEKLYKDVINYYPKSEQAKTAKAKLQKL
ncbi:MAG: tol-pal system protein YbgF [Desulfobulbaceae bacterium]|jgi:tol-pal system protein YbgF|nr:tol-pal system protein YbgF [Desulfobulbaceae bacterium]